MTSTGAHEGARDWPGDAARDRGAATAQGGGNKSCDHTARFKTMSGSSVVNGISLGCAKSSGFLNAGRSRWRFAVPKNSPARMAVAVGAICPIPSFAFSSPVRSPKIWLSGSSPMNCWRPSPQTMPNSMNKPSRAWKRMRRFFNTCEKRMAIRAMR